MITITIKNIWRNFKTVQQWTSQSYGQLPCRKKCGICEKAWSETKTKFIHLAVPVQGKNKYICDPCLSDHVVTK